MIVRVMRILISWFRSWFVTASVERRLSGSMERLRVLAEAQTVSMKRLDRRAKELETLENKIKVDLDDARRVHRQYESSLEQVREQNRVLETTINTLVASHKLLLERYDSEAAIEVRRRVAAAVRE